MFCLTFAPVIAAAQADCARAAKDEDHPNRGGATMQAACDAANVRPEDMSDAERRAAGRRGPGERRSSHRQDHHRGAAAIDELLAGNNDAHPVAYSIDGSSGDFAASARSQSIDFSLVLAQPASGAAGGLFSTSLSADFQPTGPPIR